VYPHDRVVPDPEDQIEDGSDTLVDAVRDRLGL